MSTDNQQTQRIKRVEGDAIYHYHEAPPEKPFRPARWLYGLAAALALGGGTLVTTQINAQTVYYCASHNTVKYHTDATCPHLKACGATVKSMPLGEARSKMALCKHCH
jgi:hypothetical protein